ncbi:hypothetical protein ABZZ80_19540 [Streptomyces sp. NPDC006356]
MSGDAGLMAEARARARGRGWSRILTMDIGTSGHREYAMQRSKFLVGAAGVVGGVTAVVAPGGLVARLLDLPGATLNAFTAIELVACACVGALAILAAISVRHAPPGREPRKA